MFNMITGLFKGKSTYLYLGIAVVILLILIFANILFSNIKSGWLEDANQHNVKVAVEATKDLDRVNQINVENKKTQEYTDTIDDLSDKIKDETISNIKEQNEALEQEKIKYLETIQDIESKDLSLARKVNTKSEARINYLWNSYKEIE